MFKQIITILAVIALAVSNPLSDKRIVGGGTVMLGVVPSMVSFRNLGSSQNFAGGCLISSTWALTGAHYMIGRGNTDLNIVMGIVDLAITGTVRQSNLISIHQHYERFTRINDIALVRWGTAVVFTEYIQPVALNSNIVADGQPAHISGWGAFAGDKGLPSQQLMRLSVITVPCNATDADDNRVSNVSSNICASGITANTGICTSDVGGPLIGIGNSGLIGIASWHRNPCGAHPDVYARISQHRNWIRSLTGI